MNNLRIEFKYAILISLLMLLWLALEFMVGLHEEPLMAYHPIVTWFALLIPIVCARMAVKEKMEQLGDKITFKQAFLTGFLVAFFAAVLAIPCQLTFNKLINPDFFSNMIIYAVNTGKAKSYEEAALYFNPTSYIIQAGLGTLVFGTIIAAITAWRMRTN